MKLLFGLVAAQIGLTLVCFGMMARVSVCQKNMEDAFLHGGSVLLFVAAFIVLFPSTIAELIRRIGRNK